jgi:hypothetical protein
VDEAFRDKASHFSSPYFLTVVVIAFVDVGTLFISLDT